MNHRQPPRDRDDVEPTWAGSVESDPLSDSVSAIETLVDRFNSELIPLLKDAPVRSNELNACADELRDIIQDFDDRDVIPHNIAELDAGDARKALIACMGPKKDDGEDGDKSSVTKMFKTLYRQIEHCDFGNHNELLLRTKEIVDDFYATAMPGIRQLGLEFYEAEKMILMVDAILGIDLPLEVPDVREQRRRQQAKDPDKIEKTLMHCLGIVLPLRDNIIDADRKERFDLLVIRICQTLFPELKEPEPPKKVTGNRPQGELEAAKYDKAIARYEKAMARYEKEKAWYEKESAKGTISIRSQSIEAVDKRFRSADGVQDPKARREIAALVDKVMGFLGSDRVARAEGRETEDAYDRGKRIDRAIKAAAIAQKIGKWMRKAHVDATEFQSARDRFSDTFDKLNDLAIGRDSPTRDMEL